MANKKPSRVFSTERTKAVKAYAKTYEIDFEIKADDRGLLIVNAFRDKKPLFGSAGFIRQNELCDYLMKEIPKYAHYR